jgi:hypothetical protein
MASETQGAENPGPSRRQSVVVSTIALLLLAGVAIVYNRSLPPKLLQPRLSAVSCRWMGRRVVVSGTIYNPNGSSRDVYVTPAFRLIQGPTQDGYLAPRKFEPLAGHASVRWTVSLMPRASRWQVGDKIASCAPSAWNVAPAEHD